MSEREILLRGGNTDGEVDSNFQALAGDGNVGSVIWHEATLDLGNAVDAATVGSDVTVTGVDLGDMVIGCSLGVDVQDLTLDAQVTAADTVTVTVNNNTGGAIDLASTTVRLMIYTRR